MFDEIGPRKEWLDEIESERPIAITSKDGHSMWVNSKALEIAQITPETPQPEEGVIKKDPKTGQPSGLLQEPGAMNIVSSAYARILQKRRSRNRSSGSRVGLMQKGSRQSHEAMLGLDEPTIYEAYDELAQEGLLTVRYRASWNISPEGDVMAQVEKGKELGKQIYASPFQGTLFQVFC